MKHHEPPAVPSARPHRLMRSNRRCGGSRGRSNCERALRERGLTLAVLVRADGEPALNPPVELPEERRAQRRSDPVPAPAPAAPVVRTPPTTIRGRIRDAIGSGAFTIDEIGKIIGERNRRMLANNIATGVAQGYFKRVGSGRGAKFANAERSE